MGWGHRWDSRGTAVILLLKPLCILTPAFSSLKTSSAFILTEARTVWKFKAWLGLSTSCSGLVLWTPLLLTGCSLGLVVCVCVCSQWCPILCDPVDCSPPGSSVHGVSQARILEWVAISFSRGSSQPRDQTSISCPSRWIVYTQKRCLNSSLRKESISVLGLYF